ncbi:hypothetical protein [Sinanaerobacter sp. ZZT-01]|uniref:hypothetical protein n=1 Tax=Sinanaerobacter sp. ZZT-01 TaxID=3111540 RepID=UPI002D78045B|nr:hypothetical protein [Sinanaerobacter sp. ZZT-01]WRR92360.1 hypothetical protein U5921_09825 [Sinanaerobacter sp. ZZT-01]
MESLKEIQIEFFETLQSIQEAAVYQALGEYDESDSLEDLLYHATYEAITSVFELIDGYTNENLKLDLVEMSKNISLKTGIQMHDKCADYLKWKSEKIVP